MRKITSLEMQFAFLSLRIAFLNICINFMIWKRDRNPRKKKNIIKLIYKTATKQGVDPDLAVRVAQCESNFNPQAQNVTAGRGLDRGIFQWNSHYHPEISDTCAYDIRCATKAFCKAVKKGKLYWWQPSRACWQR